MQYADLSKQITCSRKEQIMTDLAAIAELAKAHRTHLINKRLLNKSTGQASVELWEADMLFTIGQTCNAINNAANSNAPEQCVDELKSHIEMLLRYISNGDAFEMHMLATKALQIVVALNTAWDVLTNKPSKIDRTSTAPY
jgi:hypothetical protein